jgi:LysR family glycine cleavage system transcriptional activator
VAITEAAYVRDDIEAGRLVAPFGLTLYQAEAYYLVYPPGKLRLGPFSTFRRWVLEQAQETRRALFRDQSATAMSGPMPPESRVVI